MNIKTPFMYVGRAFSELGHGLGRYIRSRLTKKGLRHMLLSMAAMNSLNKVIYYNGGRLHMTKRRTRCDKEVELDEYVEHINTCNNCIALKKEINGRKALAEQTLKEYEIWKELEDSVQENIEESNILNEGKLCVDEILKMAIELPIFGKKMSKLYAKYLPKLLKIKEKEIKEALEVEKESISSELASIDSKINDSQIVTAPTSDMSDLNTDESETVELKLVESEDGLIQKIKNIPRSFKNFCSNPLKWFKIHKKTLIALTTFAAQFTIQQIVGFSIMGAVWGALKPAVDKIPFL